MNKKLIMIVSIVVVVVMAATGTALAYNGNGSSDGSSQNFTAKVEDFTSVEAYHAAVLDEKIAIIGTKVDDGSMSEDEAKILIAELSSCDCDEDCTLDGENKNRPDEGRGIFGSGTGDGVGIGEGNGLKGNSDAKGTGNGERLVECDEDGVPLTDGSGTQGYRGGRD